LIEVPYLSYDELKSRAADVLEQSSCRDHFPVDIELIVERDFSIEIVPIVGLQTAYQIDAFISKDLKTITVDESVLDNRINRYRFSLAHELGHKVLHEQILAGIDFETTAEWKECIAAIPHKQYGFLEYQANTFANALLIPQLELERRLTDVLSKIRSAGMDPNEHRDICLNYVSTDLAKLFQVSQATMEIRLGKESLF